MMVQTNVGSQNGVNEGRGGSQNGTNKGQAGKKKDR